LKRYHIYCPRTGQYFKGQEPINKGKKWNQYMSSDSQKACLKTTFKKGSIPNNYLPIGTEIRHADGYLYRKLADTKPSRYGWKSVHRIIWEEVNGPIPPKHKLIFADGNRSNFALDNLILVSDAKLAVLNKNRLICRDTDLTKTGIIIADILTTTTIKQKKMKEGKNNAK
jgi:hypothetical protein